MATEYTFPRRAYPIILDNILNAGIREPDTTEGTATTSTITWNIDLTPEEDAIVLDCIGAGKTGIDYDLYVVIKDELAVMRQFMQTASPTNAQQTAAVKALIRVVRSMLRD